MSAVQKAGIDPWLLDQYRRACECEGLQPRKWIEQMFRTVPHSLESLSINLTPQLLTIPSALESNQPDKPTPLDSQEALLLIQLLLRDEGAKSIPVKSLDLSGNEVDNTTVQEICFLCACLSSRCLLEDLSMRNCEIFSMERNDPVFFLSLCRPLRQSLRRLILSGNPHITFQGESAWKRLINNGGLAMLCIKNTGLQNACLQKLCSALCEWERAHRSLRVLRLGPPAESTLPYFDDTSFCALQRCVANLHNLVILEVAGLTEEQQVELSKEWALIKGDDSMQQVVDGCFRLSKHGHSELEKFPDKAIQYVLGQAPPAIARSTDVLRPVPNHPEPPPNAQPAKKTSKATGQKRQRNPVLFNSRPRQYKPWTASKHKQPQRQYAGPSKIQTKLGVTGGKIGDGTGALKKRGAGVGQGNGGVRRPKKKEGFSHFESLYYGSIALTSDSESEMTGGQKSERQQGRKGKSARDRVPARSPAQIDLTEGDVRGTVVSHGPKTKRQKKARRRVLPHLGMEVDNDHDAGIDVHTFLDEEIEPADVDLDFDKEEEKTFGPPPGGRTFNNGKEMVNPGVCSDLKGYCSDGFVRPDAEVVYTTTASDNEIQQDMENVHGRRPVILSSDSDSPPQNPTPDLNATAPPLLSPIPDSHNKKVNRQKAGSLKKKKKKTKKVKEPQGKQDPEKGGPVNKGKSEKRERRGKRKRKKMTELQKEMASLEAFHYDRFKETYRPGKIFANVRGSQEEGGEKDRAAKSVAREIFGEILEMEGEEGSPMEGVGMEEEAGEKLPEKHDEIEDVPVEGAVQENEEGAVQNTDDMPPPQPVIELKEPDEGELDEEAKKKRAKREREMRRLQAWSWDKRKDLVPPNVMMYQPSRTVRQRQIANHYTPNWTVHPQNRNEHAENAGPSEGLQSNQGKDSPTESSGDDPSIDQSDHSGDVHSESDGGIMSKASSQSSSSWDSDEPLVAMLQSSKRRGDRTGQLNNGASVSVQQSDQDVGLHSQNMQDREENSTPAAFGAMDEPNEHGSVDKLDHQPDANSPAVEQEEPVIKEDENLAVTTDPENTVGVVDTDPAFGKLHEGKEGQWDDSCKACDKSLLEVVPDSDDGAGDDWNDWLG